MVVEDHFDTKLLFDLRISSSVFFVFARLNAHQSIFIFFLFFFHFLPQVNRDVSSIQKGFKIHQIIAVTLINSKKKVEDISNL